MKRYCTRIGRVCLMIALLAGQSITVSATELQSESDYVEATPEPVLDLQNTEAEAKEQQNNGGQEQGTLEPTNSAEDADAPTPSGSPILGESPVPSGSSMPSVEPLASDSPTPSVESLANDSSTPSAEPSASGSPLPSVAGGGEENETELIKADGSFYYLKGIVREGGNSFVSDIEIYPTGIDGFTQLRIGEEGEFGECLVIDEDAIDGVIKLQFFDGERITHPLELTYSRDTMEPYIEVVSGESENLIENVILLSTPQLFVYAEDEEVWTEDDNKISGSGIAAVYFRYDGNEECCEMAENVAVITLPDSFYGTVEIWCKDRAGNQSEVYSATYLTDVTKPQINISTRLSNPQLTYDELLVEIMDPGDINAGIESVEYTLNGNVVLPELTISSKIVLQNNEVSDGMETSEVTIYSFIIQIAEENSELSIDVTDYAGNTQQCDYIISKEPKPEAYQIQLPDKLLLTIDPYQLMNDEQIVSEENYVVNKNDFPVTIKIVAFEYHVNKSNFPKGITPCELSMSITGEDPILLQEGISDDVIEVVLEPGEQRDICFYGSLAPDTEHLWRAGDIDIQFVCLFDKQRNLIVEKLVVDEENLAYEQETND